MSNSRALRRRLLNAPEDQAVTFVVDFGPMPGEPCVICLMLGRRCISCTIHHSDELGDDDHCVQNVEEAPPVSGAPSAINSTATGAICGHSTR